MVPRPSPSKRFAANLQFVEKETTSCSLFFCTYQYHKMRKTTIAVALTLLTASCSTLSPVEEEEIRKAAYGYCDAMANYRIDDAIPYCTEQMVKTTLQTAHMLMQYVDSAYIANDTPAVIEIKKVRLTSDSTAEATYHKKTPIKDFTNEIDLKKENGRWLVYTSGKKHKKKRK